MTRVRLPVLVARFYVLLVLGFIFLPIAVLVTFSFQEGRLPIPPFNGPSLKWYAQVLSDRDMIAALLTSLYVGAMAALAATTLGFLSAYGVARFALPYRGVIEVLMLVPASVSYLIVGLGLLVFLGNLGIRPSLLAVGIGHTVITLPIAFSLILSQMEPSHIRAEMAARDLGASELGAIFRITLPLMAAPLLAAFAICFSLSWDEFIIAFLLSRFDVTLPVEIWTSLRSGLNPFINAAGTLIFMASLSIFLLFTFGLRKKTT